jgi:3-isopropylmalate/(R)-2-methylmalate dehydratase large subunit
MIEKILARSSGASSVSPGEVVVAEVDQTIVLDMQTLPNAVNWRTPLHVAKPDRVAVVLDHTVPSPSVGDAVGAQRARELAERFGLRLFDLGGHGISHQLIAEHGLARPGELLLCADSHTCASGAFNCAARGVGGLEILQVLCTGSTWFVVAPTVKVVLSGTLPEFCEGKDVFFELAKRYGSAENSNLEFGGTGLGALSLHDRRTLATQCAEINAEFVLFPADQVVRDYLAERGIEDSVPVEADDDAEYRGLWELDLGEVEPQVAAPGGVIDNVRSAGELRGVALDQCFIGSCANGHLEDFATAAAILRGRKVAAGTRLIVTPASQQVYLDAVRAGHVETIVEAGGTVTSSTCGACFGYHMGVLGDGETCLTASTRNFKGRMGSPSAEVYMGSTHTVAASAVAGFIIDPRELEGAARAA